MRSPVAAVVAVIVLASPGYCDIVLDDFDLIASTESPLMVNDFVPTANVGAFSAQRNIRILGSTTHPTGTLDSSATATSVLTADLATLSPRERASIGFQFWYAFDSADLSDGGKNNAIFIDFLETRTNNAPLSTQAFIRRANAPVDTPISEEPFTLVIPFSDISPNIDFSQISLLNFTVSTPQQVGGADFDLSASIERIRVGFLVPEPGTISIVLSAALCGVLGTWRSR